ncbi:glycosyltransferase [Shewanella fodinae]|uniref:glycosyltransferase n=1 Tax=Shewanella fodinae TaxID=552357 RepID=UPI001671EE08|nr:glycosyltransferase [Shewanella fodinae]MCL2906285.1 glycosyltransferase [Shewanella fodinae]GGZ00465.1 hypothetical protein GCM10007169_16720 [Shewanella fodinae]
MKEKTFSVSFLTYGNRLNYLFISLENVLVQDFENIYIFANGLEIEVLNSLHKWCEGKRIKILESERNLGSAGGYKRLIKYIADNDSSDLVLLLDDDNALEPDFVDKARGLTFSDNVLYYFHRPDRVLPYKSYYESKPSLLLGAVNNFLGRSVFGGTYEDLSYDGDLLAAPYGGLLLSRSSLESNILPNDSFYLYADDYDYTFRLVMQKNFKILYTEVSLIHDLERSFHLVEKNSKKYSLFQNRYFKANKLQLYYSVRNQVFFSLKNSNSKFLFFVNMIVFYPIFILQFLFYLDFKRIFLFNSAIYSGFKMFKCEMVKRNNFEN